MPMLYCILRSCEDLQPLGKKQPKSLFLRFLCSSITNTHAHHQTAEPILLIWTACIRLLLHTNNPSLIRCLHMYKMCTLEQSVVWYVYTLSGRFQRVDGVPYEVANYWPPVSLGVQGALCVEACVSIAQYRCVGRCHLGLGEQNKNVGAPFREFSRETWESRKRMENDLTVINQKKVTQMTKHNGFEQTHPSFPPPVAVLRPPALKRSIGLRQWAETIGR